MSVCNGAGFLAKAGLLDGKEVTTVAGGLEGLQREVPMAKVVAGKRWVDNGKIVTCGGLSAGIDGALYVAQKALGQGWGEMIAVWLEYDWHPNAKCAWGLLADEWLPNPIIDWQEFNGIWTPLRYAGDTDHWENKARFETDLSAEEFKAQITENLTRVYKWSAREENTAEKNGHSLWAFRDKRGRNWHGTVNVQLARDKRGVFEVTIRIDLQSCPFTGAKAGEERVVAGTKLCWCPAGRFMMGSPQDEPERRPGEDQVEVTLTKGFWTGKYEVMQGQWKRVVGKLPGPLTAELPEGDDFPVGNVNFAEAEAFCQKLSEIGHQSGDLPKDWEFRLPTEAQWEYACRAGTTTATSFGDKLSSKQANFRGKPYNGAEPGPSLGRAAAVGSYPANAWGLHDMHGNIFEWCRDWYHAKLPGGVDPDLYFAKSTALKNRTGDVSRVRRGGAWCDDGWPCRSAFRLRFEPERRYDHIGFRVVAVQK